MTGGIPGAPWTASPSPSCYYTSQAVVQLRPETGGSITRLPADEIERVVIQDLLHALTHRMTAHTLLGPDAPIAQRLALTQRVTALAGTLPHDRATPRALIKKVTAGQKRCPRPHRHGSTRECPGR